MTQDGVLGALGAEAARCRELATACADAHRLGEVLAASELMIGVADLLSRIAQRLEHYARGWPDSASPSPARACKMELEAHIDAILKCQQRGDVIGIADLLDYEVVPLLGKCAALAAPNAAAARPDDQ